MSFSSKMRPRLFRTETTKKWTQDPQSWIPETLLTTPNLFPNTLTVKRSQTSRFFMYEEHGTTHDPKLSDTDGLGRRPTEVFRSKPSELASLLTSTKHRTKDGWYYYWTSPVANVAPALMPRFQNYQTLHHHHHQQQQQQQQPQQAPNTTTLLDPRGPSLWLGTSGSSTQAHYDVADNVIVQLYGSKRVRCYPPSAATALHVFPDAHPRSRKSQVDFDRPDYGRFPFFKSLGVPVMDVVLRPGDALFVPAFWFHHVENGRLAGSSSRCSRSRSGVGDIHHNARIDGDEGDDGPSLSVNVFALSPFLSTAQEIFQNARRPLGSAGRSPRKKRSTRNGDDVPLGLDWDRPGLSVAVLRALGLGLMKGLDVSGGKRGTTVSLKLSSLEMNDFIRRSLLESRYAPLRGTYEWSSSLIHNGDGSYPKCHLTISEREAVETCITQILPAFERIRYTVCDDGTDDAIEDGDEANIREGIVHLVAMHLLELWAVELVGVDSVAEAWDAALR